VDPGPFLYYILDESGEPQGTNNALVWAEWFERRPDRVVLQTVIRRGRVMEETLARRRRGVAISTVFLGLDHAFLGGPPVLWESMIFGGPFDGECDRYTSKLAALEGHVAMVERCQAVRRLPRRLKLALAKRADWTSKRRLTPRERRVLKRFDLRHA